MKIKFTILISLFVMLALLLVACGGGETTAAPESEATQDQETISDMRKKTIMVIDDSIVIRKMIEIALEDEDFNIVTAISGKEGLEIIENQAPNLVILDMISGLPTAYPSLHPVIA